MKTVSNLLKTITIGFILLVFSCQQEESILNKGTVTFSPATQTRNNARVQEVPKPAFALLSIKKENGEVVVEKKKLSLFSFGQGYVSENLELPTGSYQLTQFMILSADNSILYATPVEGSALAQFVADPLPISFTITENKNNLIVPQVLTVEPTDKPENFGYASFGFEVVAFNQNFIKKIETRDSNDGKLLSISYYTYSQNQLITIKSFLRDNDDFILANSVHLEYKNNLLYKVLRLQGNGLIGEYFYHYTNGQLSKVDVYSTGTLFASRKFSYFGNKVRITQQLANKAEEVSSYHEFEFIGNNINQYSRVENGVITKCYSYTYNENKYNPFHHFPPLFYIPFPFDNSNDLFGVINSENTINEKYDCLKSKPIQTPNYKYDVLGYPIESGISPNEYLVFYY
jgi:hypothetical protein